MRASTRPGGAESAPARSMDLRRGSLAVLSVLVACLAVLAPVAWFGVVDARPRVAVIGDSITYSATDPLEARLGDAYDFTIDGRPGFTVAEQLDAAERISRQAPEQVIINLGTNDVMRIDGDPSEASVALAQMVALFPRADCIHLVTINERMLIRGGTLDAAGRSRAVNRSIATMAEGDPRVTIIEWSSTLGEWQDVNPGQVLTTDTVHPNEQGNALLVDSYQDALSACQPPR